jgi:hypothetical protein
MEPTTHSTIYAAISAAQSAIEPIVKGRKADIKSAKGSFSYTYADLASVLEAVMPVLGAHGIAVTQSTNVRDNGAFVLTTSLWQTNGDGVVEGDYLIQARDMNDPQAIGSAVTFARRYALIAMLCLATEDDDGQRAQQHRPERIDLPSQENDGPIMLDAPTALNLWNARIQTANLMENPKARVAEWTAMIDQAIHWRSRQHIGALLNGAATERGKESIREKVKAAGIDL